MRALRWLGDGLFWLVVGGLSVGMLLIGVAGVAWVLLMLVGGAWHALR